MDKKICMACLLLLSWSQLAAGAPRPVFSALSGFAGVGGAADFPETSSPEPEQKEWTVMVFMNAKNDLESAGLKDMNEMELAGSSDKVNIVVELGRIRGHDASDGDWTGVRRYLVQRDTDTARIASPVLQDLGNSDMGDYRTLADFGTWAKTEFPAKKYMLIVWNHGTGWNKAGILKGISEDHSTGHIIRTPQLGLALKAIGGVDIYASDACLMQMSEVAYEIRDYADFIAGSEDTEPMDGYAYDDLLGRLLARPGMSPEDLGRAVVDSYVGYYERSGKEVSYSLLFSKKLPGLVLAMNEFVAALMAGGEVERLNVRAARDYALSFGAYKHYKDLLHFVSLVSRKTTNPVISAKGRALQSVISEEVVVYNRVFGPSYLHAGGISSAMHNFSHPYYPDLAIARDSLWDEFVEWHK